MIKALSLFEGNGSLTMEKLDKKVICKALPGHMSIKYIELGGKDLIQKMI